MAGVNMIDRVQRQVIIKSEHAKVKEKVTGNQGNQCRVSNQSQNRDDHDINSKPCQPSNDNTKLTKSNKSSSFNKYQTAKAIILKQSDERN